MRLYGIFALVLALTALSGCRETLYTGMTEADANEMVYVLLNRGVDAKKESLGKTGFAVTVDQESFTRSLEIIKEHSLPREKFQSLGSVFSGQGMISSQLEEQSRLAFAISQELSNTFSKIDGVLDARVHVVLMHNEQGTGIVSPPSASVFVRHVKDSPVVDMVGGIRETTARAVPGLDIANVSVVLENFKESVVITAPVRPESAVSPLVYALIGLIGAFLGAGLLAVFLKIKRKKPAAEASPSNSQSQSG
ncbi:MAG: type III secretion inner membrane ring lipoprotein SctJ [Succinivibrionaceae bacterium]|nr:type III secretion inner membrane ring lipoprotein SctJ [Succinivibrionaceae bacterium]